MTYASMAASAAYKTSQKLDQRPAAVLAAAHQELAVVLTSAIDSYRRGALDEMCRHNTRALQLLYGLIAAMQGHSPDADRMAAQYGMLRDAINMVLVDSKEINTLERGVEWTRTMTRSFLTELKAA